MPHRPLPRALWIATTGLVCFAVVVVLAACASPTRDAPDGAVVLEPMESVHLRVMTYNIRHGRGMDDVVDLERISRVIDAEDPDIVLLQEVDEVVRRSGSVDQAAWLGARLGMAHRFAPFMDHGGGRYGMALLTRWPIVESGWTNLPPGSLEPRTMIHVVVEVRAQVDSDESSHPPIGTVLVAGVHFDWLKVDSARVAQTRAAIEAMDSLVGRASLGQILAGDVNDVRGSTTDRLLAAAFPEVADGAGEPSFPSDAPRVEIDRVLHRGPRLVQRSVRVIDEPLASDHRPVVAEFWIVDDGFSRRLASAVSRRLRR